MTRFHRQRDDRGASLVEFAFVVPLLFALVFGIIEFGWAFNQQLDVRHGAREGARLAAVDFTTSGVSCTAGGAAPCNDTRRTELVNEICSRMDASADSTIIVTRTAGDFEIGDSAFVTVESDLDTLTGFFDFMLSGINLKSSVETRLEQDAEWSETPSGGITCP